MTLPIAIELGADGGPALEPALASGASAGRGKATSAMCGLAQSGVSAAQQDAREAESFRSGWQSLLASLASSLDASGSGEIAAQRVLSAADLPAATPAKGSLESVSALFSEQNLSVRLETEKGSTEPATITTVGIADSVAGVKAGVPQPVLTRRERLSPTAGAVSESVTQSGSAHRIKTSKETSAAPVSAEVPATLTIAPSLVSAVPAPAMATAVAQAAETSARPLSAAIPVPASLDVGPANEGLSAASGVRQSASIPAGQVAGSPLKAKEVETPTASWAP
ncbi:MAG: hypothetical protein ABSB60_07945 [Terracidiphilus sp.]|jgi:hypothetical protein